MSVHLQVITLIMTGVGLICSAIFYFGTNEPSDYSGKNRRSRVIKDYMVNYRRLAFETLRSVKLFSLTLHYEKNDETFICLL